MAFAPATGLVVSDAADLGDRQLWTPPPPDPGTPVVAPMVGAPAVVTVTAPMGTPPMVLPPPASAPRRSHLVAKPPAAIDYAMELVTLKAELYLLTLRVLQLEGLRDTPPPPPPIPWWRQLWQRVRGWMR